MRVRGCVIVDFFIQTSIVIILVENHKYETIELICVDLIDEKHPKKCGSVVFSNFNDTATSLEVIGTLAIVGLSDEVRFVDISNIFNMSIFSNVLSIAGSSKMFVLSCQNVVYYLGDNNILEYSMFSSISISGSPQDLCNRAFSVPIVAGDSETSLLDISSTTTISTFFLNYDCNEHIPSIIERIPAQFRIPYSTKRLFRIEIEREKYFFSYPIGTSIGIDFHENTGTEEKQPWINVSLESKLAGSFAGSCVSASTERIFIRKSDHSFFLAQNECVCIVEFSPRDGFFGYSMILSQLQHVVAIAADELYLYIVRNDLFSPKGVLSIFSVEKAFTGELELLKNLYSNQTNDIAIRNYNEKRLVFLCQCTETIMKIYDITNITNDNLLSQFKFNGSSGCKRIFLESNHPDFVFIQESQRINVVNISNPKKPIHETFIEVVADHVALSRDFLYTISFFSSNQVVLFQIFNISDPSSSFLITSFPLNKLNMSSGGINSIAVRGNQVFLGLQDELLSRGGVRVIDVTNKLSPFILAAFESERPKLQQIAVDGDFIFAGISTTPKSRISLDAYHASTLILSGVTPNKYCGKSIGFDIIVKDSTGSRKENSSLYVEDCVFKKKHSETWWESYYYWFVVVGGTSLFLFISLCCCYCIFSTSFFSTKSRRSDYTRIDDSYSVNLSQKDKQNRASLKIKQDLFEINFKKIKLLEVIDSGGGGGVIYKAKWKRKIVCVKMFKKKSSFFNNQNEDFSEVEREMSVMGSISHPNILRWYGSTLEYPRIGIVMEYCENGDLNDCILENKLETLDESIRIIREICSGMDYLHERKIIHRDLKPQNVLLDSSMIVKIMDFGLSRIVSDRDDMTHKIGTSSFMAPELVLDSSYGFPVDIFAFSILIYIVLTKNTKPYGEKGGFRCELKVANDPLFRPKMKKEEEKIIKDSGFEWILEIMIKGWNHDPKKRPTFYEIEELFQ